MPSHHYFIQATNKDGVDESWNIRGVKVGLDFIDKLESEGYTNIRV